MSKLNTTSPLESSPAMAQRLNHAYEPLAKLLITTAAFSTNRIRTIHQTSNPESAKASAPPGFQTCLDVAI